MKASKTYISLETAKLLKDCVAESEYFIGRQRHLNVYSKKNILEDWSYWHIAKDFCGDKINTSEVEKYPAYTWMEIEENAEVFFGKEVPKQIDCVETLARHRVQKKYEEADLYFRENCVLINQ